MALPSKPRFREFKELEAGDDRARFEFGDDPIGENIRLSAADLTTRSGASGAS